MGQEQGSPCPPPHTPTLSRGAPSPRLPTLPAWRRQGHQAQGVCHLLFIDCHGLHCQGRLDAQERTAEMKEGGGRSERRGLLGAWHTGLQGTALGSRDTGTGPQPGHDAGAAAPVRCAGWEAPDGAAGLFSGLSVSHGGPASPRRTGSCLTRLGWLSLPPTGRCWGLGHPEVAAPRPTPSNPHSLGEEEKEARRRKEKEDKCPLSQGQQRVAADGRPSSG